MWVRVWCFDTGTNEYWSALVTVESHIFGPWSSSFEQLIRGQWLKVTASSYRTLIAGICANPEQLLFKQVSWGAMSNLYNFCQSPTTHWFMTCTPATQPPGTSSIFLCMASFLKKRLQIERSSKLRASAPRMARWKNLFCSYCYTPYYSICVSFDADDVRTRTQAIRYHVSDDDWLLEEAC